MEEVGRTSGTGVVLLTLFENSAADFLVVKGYLPYTVFAPLVLNYLRI